MLWRVVQEKSSGVSENPYFQVVKSTKADARIEIKGRGNFISQKENKDINNYIVNLKKQFNAYKNKSETKKVITMKIHTW